MLTEEPARKAGQGDPMRTSVHTDEDNIRSELAVFLRTKRKAVAPSTYGFLPSLKRRTTGLRREEVAELADVGPTWYTWLEQGREIRPSLRVLGNIAAVLQLSDVETQYLFELAGHEPQRPAQADEASAELTLQSVVDEFRSPAFIRNGRYDVLAWNDAFQAIFPLSADAAPLERNFLCRLLRADWGGAILPDYEELARACVADFRMSYARRGAPAAFVALVDELQSSSPLFARWWSEYAVDEIREIDQRVLHPMAGELLLRFRHFDVVERPGIKLVLFSPQHGSDSGARIARLASACE
jgi:transcriptional regulator with XRE-family HTH domain